MRFDVLDGGFLPDIEIGITHSRKKARKAIRRMEGRASAEGWNELSGDATTSFLRSGDGFFYLIWMTDRTDISAEVDVSILAHEATHVAGHYLGSIGEDEPCEEMRAYVTQAIVQYLVERHFRWKKRRIESHG